MIEGSTGAVRIVFDNGLAENLKLQDELYQAMKEDEFYTVQNEKESDVKKVFDKLNKE